MHTKASFLKDTTAGCNFQMSEKYVSNFVNNLNTRMYCFFLGTNLFILKIVKSIRVVFK